MKIIVDLIHPANYHYFKNFISRMENMGHEICITARDKDVLYDLLKKSKVIFLPTSSFKRSTDKIIPFSTLCCLPPVSITAYII